jgi:hypothetical protein
MSDPKVVSQSAQCMKGKIMQSIAGRCPPRPLLAIAIIALLSLAFPLRSVAQGAPPASPLTANASSALAQLYAAFSGSHAVHSVALSGEATWYAGSLEDSGPITLTAADNGSAQMQMDLAATGQITESQTGLGSGAQCYWSGKDGVVHSVDAGDCWRPALWFLPPLFLQPSVLSNEQLLVDLGAGTVGTGETVYHHVQGQIVPSAASTPSRGLRALAQRTTADIGLDPTSSLPVVLVYSVHPNGGAHIPVSIEIHYSDYRAVAGVQIPFHIERYVNGSLQLDIQLSAASAN